MILVSQGPVLMGTYDPINGKAVSGFLVDVTKIGCANSKLAFNLKTTTKPIKESCSGNKLTIALIETEKSAECSLDMVDYDSKMLAYALAGTHSAVTGSTVTAEAFPAAMAVGDSVALKYTDVTAVAVTDSTGTPLTLVAGTDYTVDADHGVVNILNLGAYVQPFKAAYTYAAQGNIVAFNKTGIEKGIIFEGTNTQDGKKYRAIIPRIRFSLDGDFNLLSTEETPLNLKGEMLYVENYASDTVYGPFMRLSGAVVA